MDDKEKEEMLKKQNRVRKVFRVIGLLLLLVGIGFVITAFVNFFTSIFSEDMQMPKLFWMFFVGFPLVFVGIVLTTMGSKRAAMQAAIKEQTMAQVQAQNEAQVGGANKTTAMVRCEYCGKKTSADSDVCENCGASL